MARIPVNLRINKVGKNYIVKDSTNGGYLARGQCFYQNWETEWKIKKDESFVLLSMTENRVDVFDILEDKEHEDYRRVKMAYNRHLKELRIHLGMEERKVKEVKLYKVAVWDYHSLSRVFHLHELPISEKCVGEYRKSSIRYTLLTPEIEEEIRAYNEKVRELDKELQSILDRYCGGD